MPTTDQGPSSFLFFGCLNFVPFKNQFTQKQLFVVASFLERLP